MLFKVKISTTVVYTIVMLLLNLVQRVSSSTSLVEIDVVLVEMTESWVLANPNRVIDVVSESTRDYIRQEGSVALENVTVVTSSGDTSALVKASGGEWVLMANLVDQECESLLLASQQNNVLTNGIKTKFNSNGWAAAYTNSFSAFARLRAQEELSQSGVSDTTVLVSLILMGVAMILISGFVLFATLRKRN